MLGTSTDQSHDEQAFEHVLSALAKPASEHWHRWWMWVGISGMKQARVDGKRNPSRLKAPLHASKSTLKEKGRKAIAIAIRRERHLLPAKRMIDE